MNIKIEAISYTILTTVELKDNLTIQAVFVKVEDIIPMPKLLAFFSFFFVTPAVLILSILVILSLAYHSDDHSRLTLVAQPANVAYAALPTNENSLDGEVIALDARAEAIRQFLARYDSPLEAHADLIVSTADKYGLDYRLIPAIAMQETNLCKKAKAGSYNCWGFGVYGGKYHHFESYEQAIDGVSETLAKKYVDKGLETPNEIMKKYTPSSNGSWAFAVNQFMKEME